MPVHDDPDPASPTPSSILIIGAGVFGLSTALSFLSRPRYKTTKITIVDAAQQLPNPSGSSVDASRIVRADYAVSAYAKLAVEAQRGWRGEEQEKKNNKREPSSDAGESNVRDDQEDGGWGGQGRYHEPGFVLTCEADQEVYVRKAFENVSSLASAGVQGIEMDKIQCLEGVKEIRNATGYEAQTGKWGYANWNSGWADAEKSVAWALERVRRLSGENRVEIRTGVLVDHLIVLSDPGEEGGGRMRRKCLGAHLTTGEKIHADLTIVAAGAWSSTLVDLRRRCVATGQALSYIDISEEEQRRLEARPVIMNMSQGMFIIPPQGRELKVARHGFGYRNPEKVKRSKLVTMDGDKRSNGSTEENEFVEVSIPKVGISIPPEGQEACREAMRELIPDMADRPFCRTRVCWYCDTPTGDFLITYPPLSSPLSSSSSTTTTSREEQDNKSLFIATGGSGHGFKFFPVIGDKIVDAIEGSLDPELADLWRWRTEEELDELLGGHDKEFVVCEDGSRAGRRGMVLAEEEEMPK